MMWPKRSEEAEILDLGPGHYSQQEYHSCLERLDQVGTYLGGDRASFKAIESLAIAPSSVLDVGCGGGGFTRKLGRRYSTSSILGIDINADAIAYAKTRTSLANVTFAHTDLADIPSKSYDVVITTLVCHHLKDAELIVFLKDCLRVAKSYVIINDLHRHPIAWTAFALLAPVLFRNRLITHDGCLSIKRAFIYEEWQQYVNQLPAQATISWRWPFRWIVTLEAL